MEVRHFTNGLAKEYSSKDNIIMFYVSDDTKNIIREMKDDKNVLCIYSKYENTKIVLDKANKFKKEG